MTPKAVLMFGIFDMLHIGHVRALNHAVTYGDSLVVAIPSDDVVAEDKGRKPIIRLADRMEMLSSIKSVTSVYPYHKFEFIDTLNRIDPDILAVSTTWGREERHLAAEQWIKERNRKIVVIPYYGDESTTRIKQRVIDQWQQ